MEFDMTKDTDTAIAAYVAEVLATAPPLGSDQMARLSAVFAEPAPADAEWRGINR
jgi:hypothetical protein